jgi:DNA gyrase subunit B
MNDFFFHQFEVYFAENPSDAEKIVSQALINKRSRESAESARINIKKKLTSSLDFSNRVEKFANCRSRDPEKRELFIVEGDSALTSCKLGRDAEFQAIIPVRGKTLNCLKWNYDRIFKSDIIIDLLKVIGCGVEIKTKANRQLAEFELQNFKWNKIVICTDADEDGFQIRTLILTMVYRLLPTLIRMGRIYIAESPLYEITVKDQVHFAYDEKEKADVLSKLGNVKCSIQRSKGLGENEPEMMWQTTMNPATRRLVRVMPEDEAKTYQMFNMLLGDDLPARKRYIAENGHRYVDLADV